METYDCHELAVCSNCIGMIANADIGDHGYGYPGMTGDGDDDHIYNRPEDDQDDNPNTRHAALIEENWPIAEGWHVTYDGEDLGFSMSSCDGCGSRLGGDRFRAHAMKERTPEHCKVCPTTDIRHAKDGNRCVAHWDEAVHGPWHGAAR